MRGFDNLSYRKKEGKKIDISIYLIPILIVILLIYSGFKRVPVYNAFVKGAKGAFPLVFDIFPYLVAIMLAVSIFRVSGLSSFCTKLVAPIFSYLGIPNEISELVLLRPFTGSGSIALLNDIFVKYGADSYVARCACCILGSSETVFYVATVYFSKTSVKKLSYALPVALLSSLISSIVSCLLCKIM